MRFTVNAKTLSAVVEDARKHLSRGVHPIYESALIEAGHFGLCVTCDDLENRVTITLDGAVAERGAAPVSAMHLGKVLKALGAVDVDVSFDEERSRLILRSGNDEFTLETLCHDDLPKSRFGSPILWGLNMPSAAMQRGFDRVAHAASRERTRFALQGTNVTFRDGRVMFDATDGRRLARQIEACFGEVIAEGSATSVVLNLPAVTGLASRLLKKYGTEEARLDVCQKCSVLSSGRVSIEMIPVDGKFPDVDEVIRTEGPDLLRVQVSDLSEGVAKASVVTTKGSQSVTITADGSACRLQARGSEGAFERTMNGTWDGSEPIRFGLNPDYLMDALKQVRTESVSLSLAGKASPIVIRDGSDWVSVVMPVSVS